MEESVEKNLQEYIKKLYKTESKKVFKDLQAYLKIIQRVEPLTDDAYWYKFVDLYFVYPDGVMYNRNKSPLQNLVSHIAHVKTLGCNALHILPFLESPPATSLTKSSSMS